MAVSSKELFVKEFGYPSTEHYFAPGRANLIGEYTDIAGGNVLPFAIQLGIDAHIKDRPDRTVWVYSLGEKQSFSLDNLVKSPCKWLNYVIGVFYIFKKHGVEIPYGFDCALNSDLPTASGLSSSAALEVLFGKIIQVKAGGNKVSDWDIVKYAKQTENEFIGLNSGIMDQFACTFGRKGQCMQLNTRTLDFAYAPLSLPGCDIVIMASNKTRSLAESKYNERVEEVSQGLKDLKPYLDFSYACQIPLEELEKYKDKITNPASFKRLKHLISDNQRVLAAQGLLKEGKIDEFGQLLYQGHLSMQNDFESSGRELDTLVSLAMKNGVKGARMTGAGFGGCAFFISDKRDTRRIVSEVKKGYKKICGLKCDCYVTAAYDGVEQKEMEK